MREMKGHSAMLTAHMYSRLFIHGVEEGSVVRQPQGTATRQFGCGQWVRRVRHEEGWIVAGESVPR